MTNILGAVRNLIMSVATLVAGFTFLASPSSKAPLTPLSTPTPTATINNETSLSPKTNASPSRGTFKDLLGDSTTAGDTSPATLSLSPAPQPLPPTATPTTAITTGYNVSDLLVRLRELESQLKGKDATIQSLNDKLNSQLTKVSADAEKQANCVRANELSRLPTDMVFRNTGCKISSGFTISDSTQQARDYLQGFLNNYHDTATATTSGALYWQHMPDVCLQDAQVNLPILQQRYDDYQKAKAKCEN